MMTPHRFKIYERVLRSFQRPAARLRAAYRFARILACAVALGTAGGGARAQPLNDAARLADDLDALLPPATPVCYVRRFSDDELSRRPALAATSVRAYRPGDVLTAPLEEELRRPRGVRFEIDITLKPSAVPAGVDPGRRFVGEAHCGVDAKLGVISCSDNGGCDSADRLRIERVGDDVRLAFRGPFLFGATSCGGSDDEEPSPGFDLDGAQISEWTFVLERRPVEDCR